MMLSKWIPWVTVLMMASFVWVAPAAADQWNERSIMTFSEPVRVPGATLAPGTYVFELADPDTSTHIVRIRNEKTSEIVTTTYAVPIKRNSASGETVLRFNPTEGETAPVALRAWFYPNSLYGHQFVYDDKEARDIASRTKSIVLSMERPDAEGGRGRLMVYDASGLKKDYRADDATTREWQSWAGNHQASAPVVRADSQGSKVTVDRLEDHAKQYIGQKVSVDAEVQDVYGPRLFTIDEPHWGDLEGEIFVYMPSASAVAVDEHDRVTVSGTVRQFVLGDVQREWGWRDLDEGVLLRLQQRPILIADRIVGGDNDSVFVVNSRTQPATTAEAQKPSSDKTAEARKPSSNNQPVTDIKTIVDDEESMVGRRVELSGIQVDKVGKDGGFIATRDGENVFVLMPENSRSVSSGNKVSIEGVVLRTPAAMDSHLDSLGDLSTDDVYVYATRVS